MSDTGTQIQVSQEPLGGHGEPCRECGAPLASDQRYCLNCGTRRAGARVDYRHYMQSDSGAAPPAPSGPPAAASVEETQPDSQRDFAPLAAVGGIAVLGLMLLVGVLIGKGNSNTVSAPAPVVRLPASGGNSGTASEGGGGSNKATTGSGSAGAGKKKTGSGGGGGEEPVEASSGKLNELNSQSGEDYVEESKKIPDEVVTPGKPPPIDKSKPPAGGEGGGLVIK